MADTVRTTKGDILDQSTWQALADQHGGPKGQPTDVTSAVIPKEADQARGDYDIHRIYRYYFTDGSYVDARTSSDGQGYEISDYKPSDTFTTARHKDEAGASPSGAGTDSQELANERSYNKNDPTGAGLPETHAERRTRERLEAAAAETKRRQDEADARTVASTAETNRHNRVSEGQAAANATANAQEIVTAQDGTKYILNKQTGQFTAMPGSNPKLPSGIGAFQPDPRKPAFGLKERQAMLLEMVSKGQITEAQMKEILNQDQALTKTLADQMTAVTNGANTAYDNLLTQRQQDITQADARLTSSNTQYSNALSFANQNAVGLARAGTTDIMGPLLRGQQLNAQRNGGMETPDAVALPKALSRYLTMDLPGMGKWAPVTDDGQSGGQSVTPGGQSVPSGGQSEGQSEGQSQAPAPEAAPSQPSAAIDNMSPQKQGADIWSDDPEMQGHVQRVMGYAA